MSQAMDLIKAIEIDCDIGVKDAVNIVEPKFSETLMDFFCKRTLRD